MFWQAALLSAQMWLGEVTRQRPQRTKFEDFLKDNAPSEVRPIPYAGGTIELTPTRQWFGDFLQRAVERDSHWSDYIWAGALAFLLDTITVAYRTYVGEMFPLCFGPDAHIERITIGDRLMFQAVPGTDNAGGGFLIDDPQAWGGDQPPGEGGEYAWLDLTRGNYTDPTNAYIESLLTTPPNKTPSLRGISTLFKRGPSGFTESGYFHAGGIGVGPRLKVWKVVVRRQPDHLATGFNRVGRHMNPMEVIYEWSTSLEYGARVPLEHLNIPNMQQLAEDLHTEGSGWSGRIESETTPREVVQDVMAQFDIVDNNSPSLGLGFRLIRRDYSFGSLRTLTQDDITRVERFSPGTYEDTKNKTRVEFPDQDNNFKLRPALYIDPANQQIQNGRSVPETKSFLGVADFEQANVIATRDGRAVSLPRAPLECMVKPTWGRLSYRGEVVIFEWSSPTFSIVMRVLAITPNGPEEKNFRFVLIEDQFATGLRTFGEPGASAHSDPAAGLDVAPPSASWNDEDFPPEGLTFTLQLQNTNQFVATITGGITFGSYSPGGQYARIWVTEPGGVQTLSPIKVAPDGNNEGTFTWPANAAGEYEFCIQTFSLRGATNGVKVCEILQVAVIGSPSASSSVSPSISPSSSVSPSVSPSISPSSSQSPSASVSPSSSASPSSSLSASVSPSASASLSVSPSASTSPSSSASPSGAVSGADIIFAANADHELSAQDMWKGGGNPTLTSGVTGAHGLVYDNLDSDQTTSALTASNPGSLGCRFQVRNDITGRVIRFHDSPATGPQVGLRYIAGGAFRVHRGEGSTLATSANGLISLNTWYYCELTALISSTVGTFEANLYSDAGSLLASLTGSSANTQETLNANVGSILAGDTTTDTYIDDVWVDSGGALHGPSRVETLYPNGAGDLTQLTRGGADSGANWSQCEEVTQNGDTDYVVSSSTNQFDSYAFQDRNVTGTPLGVVVVATAKLASGTPTIKLFTRIGGVTFEGAEIHTLTSTYKCYYEGWSNNPATGIAWTDEEINAAQFGVKCIDANARVTQLIANVVVQL